MLLLSLGVFVGALLCSPSVREFVEGLTWLVLMLALFAAMFVVPAVALVLLLS
jgi:hypothetical protein